ncbi:MAG: mechanosensitive ion channel family protein [Oscillospiraceae bacterium]|nr:mechanosensitive ion channel family protein [Oscillospiraceae bacterium]
MDIWNKFVGWAADQGLSLANVVLRVIIILALGILVMHVINRIVSRALKRSRLEKAAHSLVKTLTRTVMSVLLALMVASAMGIDVTGIVALASVLTLAVSLALQNMLGNVIGGFTLIYTHPFRSGDFVEIAGQSGTISEIGMAYTKLITADNKIISIPNNAVVSAEIVNYSATGTRRVEIKVSASYDADAKQVVALLLQAADIPGVLEDPAPFAALSNYGDSSIEYTLRVWTATEDYWTVYFRILADIKPLFDRAGVEMTYPHLNVHLDK